MKHKGRNAILTCSAIFSLLLGVIGASDGQTSAAQPSPSERKAYVEVEVEGRAAIVGGDADRAREMARADALRNAVGQVVGTYITSDTLVRNFETVRDEIAARASGYASVVNVLSEGTQMDLYVIRARVRVFLVDDKDDKGKSWQGLLQDLQNRGDLRSKQIAVIFPAGADEAEKAILEVLQQAKFKVVDPSRIAQLREDQQVQQLLHGELNPARLHELRKQSIADIIITGRITPHSITRLGNSNLVVCDASVSCQAVLLDTGEIVVARTAREKVQALQSDALNETVRTAIRNQLSNLLTRDLLLNVYANIIARVNVEVGGFERFADVDAFENALRKVPGVQKVYRQSYAGGVLTLEVEVERARRQQLTGAVESIELKGFQLRVRTDTPSRIEAQVVYKATNASANEPVETPQQQPVKPQKPKKQRLTKPTTHANQRV